MLAIRLPLHHRLELDGGSCERAPSDLGFGPALFDVSAQQPEPERLDVGHRPTFELSERTTTERTQH